MLCAADGGSGRKVLGVTTLALRDFICQQLGGEDRMSALLQPCMDLHDFLDPKLCSEHELEHDIVLRAMSMASPHCGMSDETFCLEFGKFFLPWASERAGCLPEYMRQVAGTFSEFCQQLTHMMVQLYVSLSGRRPVMMEAQVSQVTACSCTLTTVMDDERTTAFCDFASRFYLGMLLWAASDVFDINVQASPVAEVSQLESGMPCKSFRLEWTQIPVPSVPRDAPEDPVPGAAAESGPLSRDVMGLDPDSFLELFPFHFILDLQLRVLQTGSALCKMLPAMARPGAKIADVLTMRVPRVPWSPDGIRVMLGNSKAKVVLSSLSSALELSGGLHHVRLACRSAAGRQLVEGQEALVFLGSPCIASMQEMKGLGLYLADFPSHDHTADGVMLAAYRQVRAEEAFSMVHRSNVALKQTLADALAQQQEDAGLLKLDPSATTRLLVDSAGHRLLDLIDSLLVGEDVDAQSVLAARTALLQSGAGNLWKPLGVDFSEMTGGDHEVNQSLARLLGTGEAADLGHSPQLEMVSEGAPEAVSGTQSVATTSPLVPRRTVEWDLQASVSQGAADGGSGLSVTQRTLSLAAYRKTNSMRVLSPHINHTSAADPGGAASPTSTPVTKKSVTSMALSPIPRMYSMPSHAFRRVSFPAPDTRVGADQPEEHSDQLGSIGSDGATGDARGSPDSATGSGESKLTSKAKGWSKRLRRSSWFQSMVKVFTPSSKVHDIREDGGKLQQRAVSAYAVGQRPGRRASTTVLGADVPPAMLRTQCSRSSLDSRMMTLLSNPSVPLHGRGVLVNAAPRISAGVDVAEGLLQDADVVRVDAVAPKPQRGKSFRLATSILLLPPSDPVAAVLKSADEWQFDTFALHEVTSGRPLSFMAFHLIQRAGLIEKMNLNATKLARYLLHIEEGYGDNPYHCRTHAADVLRTLSVVLTRGGVLQALAAHTPAGDKPGQDRSGAEMQRLQRLLKCYLAAIVHDYEHRGVNNDFLIRSSDPLALLYNDMSPLEMHHASAALTLMQQPEFAFMPAASTQARTQLRKDIIELVLATDMKQHFATTSSFGMKLVQKPERQKNSPVGPGAGGSVRKAGRGGLNGLLNTLEDLSRSPTASTSQLPTVGQLQRHMTCNFSISDRVSGGASVAPVAWDADTEMLVLKMALKAADLGHLTSSIDVHKKWVARLEEELFRQGDRERTLGQPISPLMDRSKSGIQKSQCGFFSVVAQPMYTAFAQAFPYCQALVSNLESNATFWKGMEAMASVASTTKD